MGQKDSGVEGRFNVFYDRLIKPEAFTSEELVTNPNQVADHTGFYSVYNQPNVCLKPFNIECVRGRREHLFYQIIEYFNRNQATLTNNDDDDDDDDDTQTKKGDLDLESPDSSLPLYYRDLALLTYPIPATKCNCVLDRALFRSLTKFVARFYHSKRLYDASASCIDFPFARSSQVTSYLDSVYSDNLKCPCYGNNPQEKSYCSTDYSKIDFFCLDDLTIHCRQPCIVDIKMGQVTYDPMAIKEKVAEQSNKYKMLKEFGFRILGMKLVNETKDKNFGKTLETLDQVLQALHSFFLPLQKPQYRYAVIEQIVKGLQSLYEWFESKNINQLKFFSSSLLIVYDSCVDSVQQQDDENIVAYLISSVRVKMIDFAHVFHVHTKELNNDKDNNYIFGLNKLKQMLMMLLTQYQQNPPSKLEPSPPTSQSTFQ